MSTVPLITEAQKKELRLKNFESSKFDANKPKYGLFSFTGTLAILPNSYDRVVRTRRNSEGAVVTGPRNFLTSPLKSGKNADALFSKPAFISLDDKYKDPPRPQLSEKIRAEKMLKSHDTPFKPCGPVDMVSIPEHMPTDKPKIRRRRDSEGNVVFEPKNFYTSPAKKGHPNTTPGGTSFGGNFEYLSEPYDRAKDLSHKKRLESKAKMPDKPFKPTSNSYHAFNSDEDVYHADDNLKKVIKKEKPPKIAQHDSAFKPPSPVKSHLVDSMFGKIPEYLPDPLTFPTKKSPSPAIPWKVTNHAFSRPTPSISTMPINIRAEFSPLKH